jgi:hypothetical protein
MLAEGDEANQCLLVSVSYDTSLDLFMSSVLNTLRASKYLNLNCGTSSKIAFWATCKVQRGAKRCWHFESGASLAHGET